MPILEDAGVQDPQINDTPEQTPENTANPANEEPQEDYNPFMDDYQEPEEPKQPELEIDEETQKIVNQEVEKALKPFKSQVSEQDHTLRITTFFADPKNKERYGDLEGKVKDLLKKNPRISDLRIDGVFRLVAADIGNRIAREQRVADEVASQTVSGREAPAQRTPANNKDWSTASKEEFEKEKARRFQQRGSVVY